MRKGSARAGLLDGHSLVQMVVHLVLLLRDLRLNELMTPRGCRHERVHSDLGHVQTGQMMVQALSSSLKVKLGLDDHQLRLIDCACRDFPALR